MDQRAAGLGNCRPDHSGGRMAECCAKEHAVLYPRTGESAFDIVIFFVIL